MIFVDELQSWPGKRVGRVFGGGLKSCHLTTDGTIDELHAFAARIGMRREWFQNHKLAPHYDLTPWRRASAIAAGAVVMSAKDQARARRAKERA